MVKAYTLSDKIVQQGFNDFESVVGNVYKYPVGASGPELSSVEALRASGATPINIGQVTSYFNVDSSGNQYNTYLNTYDFINTTMLGRLFGDWQSERAPEICDQWVVIRRFESTPYFDTTIFEDFPMRISYKIVADCFLSVVEP